MNLDMFDTSYEYEIAGQFLLGNTEKVLIIQSGTLEVFSAKIQDQAPVGNRTHIFHAEKGDALFGTPLAENIGLLAVASSSIKLVEVDRNEFIDYMQKKQDIDQLEKMVSGWIYNLSSGIYKENIVPRKIESVEAGSEISVTPDMNLSVLQGVAWVKFQSDSVLFMGQEYWPHISKDTYFPLVKGLWLMTDFEATLKIIDSDTLLKKELFGEILDRFNIYILHCISINNRKQAEENRLRLTQRKATDRNALNKALSGLLAVFKIQEAKGGDWKNPDNPLLAAAQIVGQAMHIEVQSQQKSRNESLDSIARQSHFHTREVILREPWWKFENGPLLAFYEETNSPVALIQVSPRQYELRDPTDGSVCQVTSKIADLLSPKAYSFYRPFPAKKLTGKEMLKVGFSGTGRDRNMILVMGVFASLLGLLTPIMTGYIFDTLIPEAGRNQLLQIAGILVACAISIGMFSITQAIALVRIEGKVDTVIQSAVWDRLLSLPVAFFRNFSAGDLAMRSMGINAIRSILSGATVSAVLGFLFSTFNLALLFYYDTSLATLAVVLSFIALSVGIGTGYYQSLLQKQIMEIEGKNSGLLLQFITGISKLRVSGTEDRAFSIWASNFSNQKTIAFKAGNIQNSQATFDSSIPVLLTMAVYAWIVFVGSGSDQDPLSTGKFIAFMSAFGSFQHALLQMSGALTSCFSVIPLYQRAKPIIETVPETDESKTSPSELSGNIEINQVHFRYDVDGPLVLNGVSLTVKPGEFVAFVGESGSGKSTLLRLLLGFETPEAGTLYYDNQDLASLDVREVRRNIGVVLQNGVLMSGDIYKNIIGMSDLSIDDAWDAASMVGIEEDIKEMPMGIHTMIPAGGGTFSGGQRQRLLIARAIARKPRILYFDEATSALDNKSQAIVSKSLEGLNSTRIVIAHRLSTIMNADRIYVLDKGAIAESGTYQELINRKGIFAELAKRQIA